MITGSLSRLLIGELLLIVDVATTSVWVVKRVVSDVIVVIGGRLIILPTALLSLS